jgi:hypothetical protein
VDIFTQEADVGRGGRVPVRNSGNMLVASLAAVSGDLTALLRGIIFVSEAALGVGSIWRIRILLTIL